MKAYESTLSQRERELARFLRRPDADAEVTRRTIAVLEAEIARLTALLAKRGGK